MGAHSGGTQNPKKTRDNPGKGVRITRAMKARSVVYAPAQVNPAAYSSNMSPILTTTNTSNRFIINDKPLSDYNMDESPVDNQNKNKADTPRKLRNPPIIITGSNVSAVQNFCNSIITSKKFEFKLLSIGIRVDVASKDEFDKLCEYLKKENISNFMYHTAETRPRKIILSGLHKMEIEDLRQTLESHGINPTDIKMLKLKQNRYYYDDQSVYLLYFKPGAVKLSDLRNIKHIDHITVKWEPYTPRSHDKVPQCRNCQMFGHSSINCNMPTRCLVCAGNHVTDSCKKKIPRTTLAHKIQIG